MLDIPDDIRQRAAAFDHLWPLNPDLADRPFRLRFWGRDEAALSARIAAGGDVVHRGSAWFRTLEGLRAGRLRREGEIVVWSVYGPGVTGTDFPIDMDGREISTTVAEIHLPDGRRHLLVYDDRHHTVSGTRYIWTEGNWSCDCNRSLDLNRDGVRDLGFPLDGDGEPHASCTPAGSDRPSLRLGWLVLRFRHLVTGAVRFEVVVRPE